ncbi:hypothetical protein COCCADRAFT_10543 [Bipolaris zeicola 26-R-13]|uniref:Uncharacterized protein n=1 Tax=Cochliobolus carbonum (strain 26-R-13) TaxID=930089 RepID=W6XN03_COCC2|nr:uncharacterized protein COCCADRAFT_10543 [Bipolaris zeicola 26-R-13]EUC26655.1 hypothetical protein COCCADRAFT_10543 [Bipolaris zeicola 26-R-13]
MSITPKIAKSLENYLQDRATRVIEEGLWLLNHDYRDAVIDLCGDQIGAKRLT